MGGATFEYPGRSCVQETDSPTHCDQTQLQRKVCCNLAGPRAQEECERQAGPAVETTHRPLCGRLRQLHSRAMMTASAPSAAPILQRPISGQLRDTQRRQSGAEGIFRKQGRSA